MFVVFVALDHGARSTSRTMRSVQQPCLCHERCAQDADREWQNKRRPSPGINARRDQLLRATTHDQGQVGSEVYDPAPTAITTSNTAPASSRTRRVSVAPRQGAPSRHEAQTSAVPQAVSSKEG